MRVTVKTARKFQVCSYESVRSIMMLLKIVMSQKAKLGFI